MPYADELLRAVGVSAVYGGYVVDRSILERIGNGTGSAWLLTDVGLAQFSITIDGAEFRSAHVELVPWVEVRGLRMHASVDYTDGTKAVELTCIVESPQVRITVSNQALNEFRQLQAFAAGLRQHRGAARVV